MKKTILSACILCTAVLASAQTRLPDTAVTVKTTNNELYQMNALLTIASQNLLKSKMPVDDYIEWQKEYQAILQSWFKQKAQQDKEGKKK